ncbi:MAG: TIGR00159 family protein [Ignavibacteriales bacterium]|jgi:diadenylate cyclase|nr:diadenylate cyclase CdaA [Ignavibacteriaceae bacterium]NLH62001.1 TIGR00159 family protein [Ignavibacteriales bacterium]HOJ17642.1 diadenylate cyclase CdaA [Ignavibacteriaceae bacterium]HPO56112.1 diadenylate cyclase CdaA [Ignavibacteriaceae bacterium]
MFELFKIGFLSVNILDIVDIAIVAYIIYKLYMLLKGTIASQIFLGLVIVIFLSFSAQAINLKAVSYLLKFVTDIWIIAFIILFQPEIRRLLVILGRSPLFRFSLKQDTESAMIITDAVFEMAQLQHGALIIIIKSSGIKGITESGEQLNAKLSKNLLKSIFYPRSPLHDGAAVIKNDVIEAVRCTMPLSLTTTLNGIPLGMRHRAGLGISEQADVIAVIVSEETGSISIAENGKLTRGLSKESLKNKLTKLQGSDLQGSHTNIFKSIFRKSN